MPRRPTYRILNSPGRLLPRRRRRRRRRRRTRRGRGVR
jgi:hypothetical protein